MGMFCRVNAVFGSGHSNISAAVQRLCVSGIKYVAVMIFFRKKKVENVHSIV